MLLNTLQIPYEHPTGQPPCHSQRLSDSKHQWASQVDIVVKKLPANAGDVRDLGLIPGLGGSPGGGLPPPVFLPGESHVQRSLVGYSPWGHKEWGRSQVWCCKEQYCIGTWNVRSMNQGKLEVVKQEMARVNIDIIEISELRWTGMGGF